MPKFRDDSIARFSRLAKEKFDRGQRKYGNDLLERPDHFGDIREEIIDLWFYIEALEAKIKKPFEELCNGRSK